MTFEVRGPNIRRTINVGGSNTLRGSEGRPDSPGGVPTMSSWVISHSSSSNQTQVNIDSYGLRRSDLQI